MLKNVSDQPNDHLNQIKKKNVSKSVNTGVGMEAIEGLRFLVSLPLAGTGRTEGGEKTQPFNRFYSRLFTLRKMCLEFGLYPEVECEIICLPQPQGRPQEGHPRGGGLHRCGRRVGGGGVRAGRRDDLGGDEGQPEDELRSLGHVGHRPEEGPRQELYAQKRSVQNNQNDDELTRLNERLRESRTGRGHGRVGLWTSLPCPNPISAAGSIRSKPCY